MTYLMLGNAADPCCGSVAAALQSAGRSVRFIDNPLLAPHRFSWRYDSTCSNSELLFEDGETLRATDISGVLVRTVAYINRDGWAQEDWNYAQTELRAALLGWLWSLPCPVVNRFNAELWYRTETHPLQWHNLLARAGLSALPTLVSNVKEEAQALARRHDAVYTPLTAYNQYPLRSREDWSGLFTMQRYAPACLTLTHGPVLLACVVGEEVVWDGPSPDDALSLEQALVRFARSMGLNFVEVAFAPTCEGLRVVSVEHQPIFEQFSPRACTAITGLLVAALLGEEPVSVAVATSGTPVDVASK